MNQSPATAPQQKNYRPDIDGLRCIAVGSVIAFHATPGYAPAGFFGVDIFFVISGYLITNILLREAREGRLSIREFYKRRIRRIFPALILLLATVLIVGWFILVDSRYARLGLHAAAASGFVANILFWQESSYFVSSSDLLHLWSLGVEEQFYFVWPLLIYAIVRRKYSVTRTLIAISILSFGYSFYATIFDPTAAFYSPVSRFWQLSIGGLVASVRGHEFNQSRREALSVSGALAIAASVLLLDKNSLLPGFWALAPVLGAAAIIHAGPTARVNRLLSVKPAVWIGLISYPLYLWHWPALQFVVSFTPFDDRNLYVKLAILGSLAAATLTYILVEQPLRRRSPVLLMLAMAGIFAASLAVYANHGFPGRPVDHDGRKQFLEYYANLAERGDAQTYRAECDFLTWHKLAPLRTIADSCTAQGPVGTRFLWGDSHAQALSLGLRSIMPAGVTLAQVATSGCAPSIARDKRWLADKGPFAQSCRRSNAFALASIERLKPEIVYLVQNGGHEKTDWEVLADALRRRGAGRVILIGPVPQWQPSLAAQVADDWPQIPNAKGGMDQAVLNTDQELREKKFGNLSYVSIIGAICDASACTSRVGQKLLVVDSGHLSNEGSLYVAQQLRPALSRP